MDLRVIFDIFNTQKLMSRGVNQETEGDLRE